MTQDTTSSAVPGTLLGELWRLLAAHRAAVGQERCFSRLRVLVVGMLLRVARPTITGLLQAVGLHDADWSAFYRLFSAGRLDYERLTHCFVRQTLAEMPPTGPYVAVVDGVQLPRSSQKMPGTAWLKNPRTPPFQPGSHRAQRYLHLAALLPRWAGYSRALPLRLVPAFPPKAVPGAAKPRKEWEAALAELRWLRAGLDAAGRAAQRVLALGDGAFDVLEVWRALPERTILLSRTACNRALRALPPPGAHGNRRYGPRAPAPQAWLHAPDGWRRTVRCVRGRAIPLRYRVEGPFLRERAAACPLFLLVVKGSAARGRRRREPAFFLVNALPQDGAWVLPLPAEELLAWAWQRWEVEVGHRAMKTDWGVGAVQCWHPIATVRAAQWQAWTYALCVLAGYRAWGYDRHPRALRPPGLWWAGAARWSLATLQRGYRQELARYPDFLPTRAGTRGTWAEKEAWLRHLDALLGAPVAA
jgi:hypothetical protein